MGIMYRRLIISLALALITAPGVSLAENNTPGQSAPAAGLGPASTNASGGSLQAAGANTLQSPTDNGATGSAVPGVKLFEAPTANSQNLQVLLSQEADGAP